MKNEWHVIGKGFSGWHAAGINVSSSSYDTRDVQRDEYARDAVEGALVYDASQADQGAFIKHVVNGPMCNPKLGKDEHVPFGFEDKKAMAAMLPGLGGGFATIAVAALVEQPKVYGSLDYVGVGLYRKLLALVPGIRLGQVVNGKVAWAD